MAVTVYRFRIGCKTTISSSYEQRELYARYKPMCDGDECTDDKDGTAGRYAFVTSRPKSLTSCVMTGRISLL